MKYTVAKMARLGRRWFAHPPPEFSPPCQTALAVVSTASFGFYPNEVSKLDADTLGNLGDYDRSMSMLAYHTLQKWLRENGPTFFVDENVVKASHNTDVLASVEGSDIKTVYPVGYFALPDNAAFVSKQTGGRIKDIWFRLVERDEHQLSLWINGIEQKLARMATHRQLVIQGYWDNNTDCSYFILSLDEPGSLYEVMEATRKKQNFGEGIAHPANIQDLLAETYEYGLWTCSLCLNLCLIMQSYPAYLNKLEKVIRQSFQGEPATTYRVRLGRSPVHQLRQVVANGNTNAIGEAGHEIEAHWRRGHWRRQPHGDRFELEHPEVKILILTDGRHAHMKWIQPILVEKKE
jgi:hypothetical protein